MNGAGSRGRGAACALLGLLAAGCVFTKSAKGGVGSLLPDVPLAAIRDGETRRGQVLDALGPPSAVVHPGETVAVAVLGGPTAGRFEDLHSAPQGGAQVAAAAFFEPFGDRWRRDSRVAVDYYERVEVRWSRTDYRVVIPLWSGVDQTAFGTPEMEGHVDQLFVLVEEDTGLVLSHVLRRPEPVKCQATRMERAPPRPEAPLARQLRCASGDAGGKPASLEEWRYTGHPPLPLFSPVAAGTSKAALFELFGPPMAIAAPGEVVEVAAEAIDGAPGREAPTVFLQQADAWLVPFAARRPIEAQQRVYYWYDTVFVPGYIGIPLAERWVLVDEESGTVVDSIFRSR